MTEPAASIHVHMFDQRLRAALMLYREEEYAEFKITLYFSLKLTLPMLYGM